MYLQVILEVGRVECGHSAVVTKWIPLSLKKDWLSSSSKATSLIKRQVCISYKEKSPLRETQSSF